MSDYLKTPLNRTLPRFANNAINDVSQLAGKALPCSVVSVTGAIVTVKFEINSTFTIPNVTMPLFGPIYIRYPIQSGDKGLAIPCDTYLGGMSGLGGGVSDLGVRGNLSTLFFLPIGNTQWESVDPNAVVVYGPNGVVLRDEGSNTIFTLTPTSITMQAPESVHLICGTSEFQLTPTSYLLKGTTGTITDGSHATSATTMNDIWALLVTFLNTHVHSNGNDGSNTGAAVTPYTGGSIAP